MVPGQRSDFGRAPEAFKQAQPAVTDQPSEDLNLGVMHASTGQRGLAEKPTFEIGPLFTPGSSPVFTPNNPELRPMLDQIKRMIK